MKLIKKTLGCPIKNYANVNVGYRNNATYNQLCSKAKAINKLL